MRTSIAGSSQDSLITQRASELKQIKLTSRHTICNEAGVKTKPITMSNLSVMAMKEATDLTWSQLRQQRRYLKEAGLLMPSESKQRLAMEDLAADNIVTQMVDFVDSYGQTHRAAFGRVTNITTFVTKLLEQHKLHKTLTWHNSTIPHD
ncbi:hypothetical protein PoB_004069600 [Plakobranchus ocellatus]|uniref:Uncharacterized protein n=1 Tax=Plakobranchus ocellatus TaxID=259542 RepID=A0AAV4B5V4_9GAST|nr:hypothetical protein PoB_004069600 [Plakobranchus ocellatus]